MALIAISLATFSLTTEYFLISSVLIFRIFILELLDYETIDPLKNSEAPGIKTILLESAPPVQLSAKEIVLFDSLKKLTILFSILILYLKKKVFLHL
jgi:hypothetical protein